MADQTDWILRDKNTKQRLGTSVYTEAAAKDEVQRLLTESQQTGKPTSVEAVPLLLE